MHSYTFFLHLSFCVALQLNLSTTATLGTGESDHCSEVVVVERLKQESMFGLSGKKNGRCREVVACGGLTVP